MRLRHPALPPEVSISWIGVAVAVWLVAAVVAHLDSPAPLEPGQFQGDVQVLTDVESGRYGDWVLVDAEIGVLMMEVRTDAQVSRGDRIHVMGSVKGEPGTRMAIRYRAVLKARRLEVIEQTSSVPLRLGDALRDRVMDRLDPFDPGRGLLAGFLIGDTSQVEPGDVEAMRRSGLSHFVAVSGSNVALFLGLIAFAAGPLAIGPKRRAIVGLIGLPIYAAATRFEPSVMRASVMAGLALGGRLLGVVFEAWQLLSLAVIVLLVLTPSLTASAGFQLSVAATAGVLVGARWPTGGGMTYRALAVTIGAQIAVAPLLLVHFGTVPMMSPLVNLVAGPVVAASTLIGAVGVAGPTLLIHPAAWLANLVLVLARGAVTWPQLEVIPLGAVLLALVVFVRWPGSRPTIAIGGAAVIVFLVLGRGAAVPDPGVVVLDVGQGDAILVYGGDDKYALIDGGPDELLLVDLLRKYGVDRLDLVVLSHVHADHATGLAGLVGKVPMGQAWVSADPHSTKASERLMTVLGAHSVPILEPRVGDFFRLGALTLVVEGPIRRYASPNDQSIVLSVLGSTRTMLLVGDIETVAQAELSHLRADVLKVPHQGAATSASDWLTGVGADLAVISVGTNSFGHPASWVIEVLEASGAEVVRTDELGDVVVPLS